MHYPREGQVCFDFFGLAVDCIDNGEVLIAHVTSRTDANEMRLARKLFAPADRVLVAGAGFGGVAAMIGMLGCDVIAVEPSPVMFGAARDHVRVAGKPLTLIHAAVSDRDGEAPFYTAADWPTSSLSKAWAGPEAAENTVPLISIRHLVAEHDITAIMLDVEGEEEAILPVMPWQRINAMVIELHGDAATLDQMTNQVARGMRIVDRIDGEFTRILGAVRYRKGG